MGPFTTFLDVLPSSGKQDMHGACQIHTSTFMTLQLKAPPSAPSCLQTHPHCQPPRLLAASSEEESLFDETVLGKATSVSTTDSSTSSSAARSPPSPPHSPPHQILYAHPGTQHCKSGLLSAFHTASFTFVIIFPVFMSDVGSIPMVKWSVFGIGLIGVSRFAIGPRIAARMACVLLVGVGALGLVNCLVGQPAFLGHVLEAAWRNTGHLSVSTAALGMWFGSHSDAHLSLRLKLLTLLIFILLRLGAIMAYVSRFKAEQVLKASFVVPLQVGVMLTFFLVGNFVSALTLSALEFLIDLECRVVGTSRRQQPRIRIRASV